MAAIETLSPGRLYDIYKQTYVLDWIPWKKELFMSVQAPPLSFRIRKSDPEPSNGVSQ